MSEKDLLFPVWLVCQQLSIKISLKELAFLTNKNANREKV